MSGSIATRLRRLEAVARTKPRAMSQAERRAAVAHVAGIEASLVAVYLGGWRSGEDGMASLLRGVANACAGLAAPSLNWAAQRAEMLHSGALGRWHTAERLNAAFDAIGPDRFELLASIGNVLDRADEIGDPVMIGLAVELADTSSDERRTESGGNRVFVTEALELTHCGPHANG